jgi:hypothetical protein
MEADETCVGFGMQYRTELKLGYTFAGAGLCQ